MEVEIIQGSGATIVKAHGEIDLSNAEELQSALNKALAREATRLVLDFDEVSYIDSAGLQVMLSAYNRVMKSGGKMAVSFSHPVLKGIFHILGVATLPSFFITDSSEEAERALQAAS